MADTQIPVSLTVPNLGIPGPRGVQGPVGPKGEASTVAGPKGETGARGDTGPRGDTGSRGPQGETGDRGPAGPRGDTGAASTVPGPQGEVGPRGNTGNKGADGPKGDTGSAGRGIVSVLLNSASHLIISFTDGTTQDAGVVGGSGTATPTPAPTPTPTSSLQRLSTSASLTKGVPVSAGTKITNRLNGSTFTTTLPGITIDNATGVITGTPTAYSGLLNESKPDGTSRSTILFAPSVAPKKMKLGMNISEPNYYTRNDIFLDLMKSAGASTPPATVDALGFPQTLKPNAYGGHTAIYLLPFEGREPNAAAGITAISVAYRIITDGDMDFNGFTKQGDDYVGSVAVGLGGLLIISAIRTPPTRLAVVREDEVARFKAGFHLKQDFIDQVAGMSHLRMMDANQTNAAEPHTVPDNAMSYINGVPLEAQARLCREAGIPPWFNAHTKITDADFRAMWPLMDALVAEGLAPRFELGNEIWNEQFVQNAYAIEQATALGYTGGYKAAWWAGRRTAELAKMARGRGYKFQAGVQPAVQDQAGAWFAGQASIAGALDSDIHAWTTTNYASGILTLNPGDPFGPIMDERVAALDYDWGIDNIMNYIAPYSFSTAAVAVLTKQASDIAKAHGWKCEGYEGNWVHLNRYPYARNDSYNAYFYNIVEQAQAEQAATQNMQVSEDVGMDTMTWYTYNFQAGNSDSGRFGVRHVPAMIAIRKWISQIGTGTGTQPPATTPWTPDNLSSVILGWHDMQASTVTQVGGSGADKNDITVLGGIGGRPNAVQTNAGKRPAFLSTGWDGILPCAKFDTSDLLDTTVNANAEPFTYAFVLQDDRSGYIGMMTASNPDGHAIYCDQVGSIMLDKNGVANVYASPNDTLKASTKSIVIVTFAQGKPSSIAVNGVVSAFTYSGTSFGFEGNMSIGTGGCKIDRFGESLRISGAVSSADRQRLEGYAAHKWGFAGNLPSDHPYKSAAPTT